MGPVKHFSLTLGYMNITGLLAEPRTLIAANGSVPGPAIVVRQGDWVVVAVTNGLHVESTVHWHGMVSRVGRNALCAAEPRAARALCREGCVAAWPL